MALEYYTPGVYVEEVSSGFKPITAVPTSVVGFIGETKKGAVNKPILVTSWSDYFDEFIGYTTKEKLSPRGTQQKDAYGNVMMENVPNDKTTDLDWAVYAFFNNGGSKCYVVGVGTGTSVDNSKKIQELAIKAKELNEAFKNADEETKKNIQKDIDNNKKETDNLKQKSSSNFDLSSAIIGNDGGPNKRSGLSCFKDIDEIAILCAPAVTDMQVIQEILTYAETFNIFAIIDAPNTLEELSQYSLSQDLNGLSNLSAKCASKQASIYFPWVNIYDNTIKADRSIAPSGFVAGIYSRVDKERGVHKAPANEVVRLATSLQYSLSDAEQERLNQYGINCIREFSDIGIRVWGARTTVSMIDTEWRYINVRRLFNMVEKSLQIGSKWAVFEPNDKFLWNKLKRNVTAFLTRVYNSGALAGNNASEAFFVRCDEGTNPQENIDAGIVTIQIGIAPVKPAEFVVFRISQKAPATGEEAQA